MTVFVLYIMLASWRDPFPIKVAEFSSRPLCVERGAELQGRLYQGALVDQWECIALREDMGVREELDEK